MVDRKKNWVQCLERQIYESASKEFRWSEHDCTMFACNCILAITGIDPAANFRGKYHNKKETAVILQNYAGDGLLEAADKMCAESDFAKIPPLKAQRGDVIYLTLEVGGTLGIVSLNGKEILIAAKKGLTTRPLEMAEYAWRVG